MRVGVHRVRGPGAGLVAALAVVAVAACQPSAPPGFTGTQPAGTAAPGASVAAPNSSGLVAGKPVVTTDGGKVRVVGLNAGKSPDFELPAGSAQMTVTPCASNQVIPFVTLYDGNDTKLSIVVEPDYTLANLKGGTYYLDVAANPGCAWQIVLSPG